MVLGTGHQHPPWQPFLAEGNALIVSKSLQSLSLHQVQEGVMSVVSLHPSPGKPASSLNAPTLRTPLPLVLGME